ncbi:MAG: GNAT family N-acetyltransferase [Pseudomonadota bacterium]
MRPDVKRAVIQDLPQLIAMRAHLFTDLSDEEQEEEVMHFLQDPNYRFWLAWQGEAVVGFVEASVRPYANGCDSRPVPFLEGIWVKPEQRDQHVGQALVMAVEAWARDLGFHELGSDVEICNLRSQAAHQAWGFEERETVVYYRRLLPSAAE